MMIETFEGTVEQIVEFFCRSLIWQTICLRLQPPHPPNTHPHVLNFSCSVGLFESGCVEWCVPPSPDPDWSHAATVTAVQSVQPSWGTMWWKQLPPPAHLCASCCLPLRDEWLLFGISTEALGWARDHKADQAISHTDEFLFRCRGAVPFCMIGFPL